LALPLRRLGHPVRHLICGKTSLPVPDTSLEPLILPG
jgi:hypothetical protein